MNSDEHNYSGPNELKLTVGTAPFNPKSDEDLEQWFDREFMPPIEHPRPGLPLAVAKRWWLRNESNEAWYRVRFAIVMKVARWFRQAWQLRDEQSQKVVEQLHRQLNEVRAVRDSLQNELSDHREVARQHEKVLDVVMTAKPRRTNAEKIKRIKTILGR